MLPSSLLWNLQDMFTVLTIMEEVEVQLITSTLFVEDQSETFHCVTATTLQHHNHMLMMYGLDVLVGTIYYGSTSLAFKPIGLSTVI